SSLCGNPGQPCCVGTTGPCPGNPSSFCSPTTHVCTTSATDCMGTHPESIHTRDRNGCAGLDVPGYGDDATEALRCARDIAASMGLSEVTDTSGHTSDWFCLRSSIQGRDVELSAYSEEDLEACARWSCGMMTCLSVTRGHC